MPASRASRTSVQPAIHPRLVSLLEEHAQGEGFSKSRLPGVKFMRSTRYIPRSPIAYDPSIVIVGQGRKSGYLGGKKHVYDANHYLVLSMPMPFECETEGTLDEPVLGVSIGVTPTLVSELLMHLERPAPSGPAPQVLQSALLDESLLNTTIRLLECLRSADDTRILGTQLVREVTYRALCGPLGVNLRAIAAPHSAFGQISRVMSRMHTEFAQPHDMPTLASEAGMSVSTFHLHFKAVTSFSPLQYLKNVRLHKARMLMVHEGINAGAAALEVGYESASQFSREFKRLFGNSPATVAQELRQSLVRLA